ncbi:hypothetical protein BDD14_4677 [Edaphobacter modestus]|uniref:Uncharacterized protein n=1 Tax=Edaphobacter modestus TaxID=388466 RepID=A0A4Q7Z0M4_9BACT|nr:hypothetical protein BDD14_4677 [Edaphobacter modestus]
MPMLPGMVRQGRMRKGFNGPGETSSMMRVTEMMIDLVGKTPIAFRGGPLQDRSSLYY